MRRMLMGVAALAALAWTMPVGAAERCDDVISYFQRYDWHFNSRAAERDAGDELQAAKSALRAGDNSACLRHMDNAYQVAREDTQGGRGRSDRSYSDDRSSGSSYDRGASDRRSDERRYDDRSRTEGSGGSTNPLGELLQGLQGQQRR